MADPNIIAIDTCNCPGLEEFSSDIQDVLAKVYEEQSPSDVPVEFDGLTLLMDLQSRFEVELSCSNKYGELNDYEQGLSDQLDGKPLSELITNSIRYSGNINLGEFRPSFMRVVSERDRTLFFKGEIDGVPKYFIIQISRSGETQIEILDQSESLTPMTSSAPYDLAGLQTPLDAGFPINLNESVLEEQSEQPPQGAPPSQQQQGQGGFGGKGAVPGQNDRRGETGLGVLGSYDGVTLNGSIRTDNGNVIQGQAGFNAIGVPTFEDESGEEVSPWHSEDGEAPSFSITGIRTNVQLSYIHGLGNAVAENRDDIDNELEVRAGVTTSYDQLGEVTRQDTTVGGSYRFDDNSLDLDITRGLEGASDYELRYGNIGEDSFEYQDIRYGLEVDRPYLSFGRPQENFEDSTGSGGKGGFVPPREPRGSEEEDNNLHYSIGVQGEVGGDVSALDFSLANSGEERQGYIEGRYNFEYETLDVSGGSGTEDSRLNFNLRQGPSGETLTLTSQNTSEETVDGVQITTQTTPRITLSSTEFTPSEIGFDRIQTSETASEDGLISRTVTTHQGISATDVGSVTLSYGRYVNEDYSLDTGSGLEQYGNRNGRFVAQASISEDRTQLQAVAARETTLHGVTQGVQGDFNGVWDDAGSSVEIGVTMTSAEMFGYEGSSTNCRLGARVEEGEAPSSFYRAPSSGAFGGGSTMECNLVFVQEADGAHSAELSARYSFSDGDVNYFADIRGEFREDAEPELNIGIGGEINFSGPTSSGSMMSFEERNDLTQDLIEWNRDR